MATPAEGRLAGRLALVTGASRGLGRAIALKFAAEGADLVLLARTVGALEEVDDQVRALGRQATLVPLDITDFDALDRMGQALFDRFGRLDVLIGNAGVLQPIDHLETADPEGWGHVIDVNLKGVFHGVRAAMPVMLAAGGGTILNVSSGAAHAPLEAWSAYCASKAGAAMVTRSAHLEGADRGLRVMGLSPGTVATQMQRDIKASGINPVSRLEWEDHIPPEWPAKTLLWMCSPDADEFLGQELALRDETVRRRAGLIA